jgi:hypothetical protein
MNEREVLTTKRLSGFEAVLNALRRLFSQRRSQLSYYEAIDILFTKRPPNERVSKALFSRRRVPDGLRLDWMFLDDRNQVCCTTRGTPYIYQLRVHSLDDELEGLFGNRDLVIFT